MSDSLWKDVNSFNYSFLLDLVTRLNWGEDVSNLLLVGMPDVVTPAHFDILENLYVQVGTVCELCLMVRFRATSWPLPFSRGKSLGTS